MGSTSGSVSKNGDLHVHEQMQDKNDLELFFPRVLRISPDNTDASRLTDFELLKCLLAIGKPKRDINRLAHRLLATFGTFAKTISAREEDLIDIDGIGNYLLFLFKVVQHTSIRLVKAELINEPILNNDEAVTDYLLARLSHEPDEKSLVLYLNRQNRLIADEIVSHGTDDFVGVDPKIILQRVIRHHATAIILVHNHPSGNANPNQPDIEHTKTICAACSAVGVIVHDHYIVGNGVITRLKQDGFLAW